jgi:hypothetical protein
MYPIYGGGGRTGRWSSALSTVTHREANSCPLAGARRRSFAESSPLDVWSAGDVPFTALVPKATLSGTTRLHPRRARV